MENPDPQKKIKFTKMQGTGSDFVVLEKTALETLGIELTKDFIKDICDRHFGVGSDGLIIVNNTGSNSYKFKIYNSDGGPEEVNGNGIMCLVKYLDVKKLVDYKGVEIETDIGKLGVQIEGVYIVIDMGKSNTIKDLKYKSKKVGDVFLVKASDKTFKFTPISMGNSHAVIYLNKTDLNTLDISKYGKIIQDDQEIFTSKANIEFVKAKSDLDIDIRVWGRGTGEVLSCGTGACAAVVSGVSQGILTKNEYIKINFKGGTMWAKWSGDPRCPVILKGKAEKIYSGVYKIKNTSY